MGLRGHCKANDTLTEFQKEKRERKGQEADNLPNLGKETSIQTQEAPKKKKKKTQTLKKTTKLNKIKTTDTCQNTL